MEYNEFKEYLKEESDYPLTDAIYNEIVEKSELLYFNKGDAIIDIGVVDPDFYFLRKGVVRGYLFHDGEEKNICFGLTGTFFNSMHSFLYAKPSILRIEACTPTEVYRYHKSDFIRAENAASDVYKFIMGAFTLRAYYSEVKARIMAGDSKWRYEWLRHTRPELLENVPLKAIASYLGMSVIHISRVRKELARSQGKSARR